MGRHSTITNPDAALYSINNAKPSIPRLDYDEKGEDSKTHDLKRRSYDTLSDREEGEDNNGDRKSQNNNRCGPCAFPCEDDVGISEISMETWLSLKGRCCRLKTFPNENLGSGCHPPPEQAPLTKICDGFYSSVCKEFADSDSNRDKDGLFWYLNQNAKAHVTNVLYKSLVEKTHSRTHIKTLYNSCLSDIALTSLEYEEDGRGDAGIYWKEIWEIKTHDHLTSLLALMSSHGIHPVVEMGMELDPRGGRSNNFVLTLFTGRRISIDEGLPMGLCKSRSRFWKGVAPSPFSSGTSSGGGIKENVMEDFCKGLLMKHAKVLRELESIDPFSSATSSSSYSRSNSNGVDGDDTKEDTGGRGKKGSDGKTSSYYEEEEEEEHQRTWDHTIYSRSERVSDAWWKVSAIIPPNAELFPPLFNGDASPQTMRRLGWRDRQISILPPSWGINGDKSPSSEGKFSLISYAERSLDLVHDSIGISPVHSAVWTPGSRKYLDSITRIVNAINIDDWRAFFDGARVVSRSMDLGAKPASRRRQVGIASSKSFSISNNTRHSQRLARRKSVAFALPRSFLVSSYSQTQTASRTLVGSILFVGSSGGRRFRVVRHAFQRSQMHDSHRISRVGLARSALGSILLGSCQTKNRETRDQKEDAGRDDTLRRENDCFYEGTLLWRGVFIVDDEQTRLHVDRDGVRGLVSRKHPRYHPTLWHRQGSQRQQ